MFSIHGIMGDIPPVTALLGMTCFGLGLLYIACYCAERIARDIYRKLKKDTNIFNPEKLSEDKPLSWEDLIHKSKEANTGDNYLEDIPEDIISFLKKCNDTEESSEQTEPTLFSEEELNAL